MEQAQLFLLSKGGRENGFSEITEELAVLPSLPSTGFPSKKTTLLGTLQGQGCNKEMDKPPEGKKTFRIFGLGYLWFQPGCPICTWHALGLVMSDS